MAIPYLVLRHVFHSTSAIKEGVVKQVPIYFYSKASLSSR